MDVYIRGALYVIATQLMYGCVKYVIETFIGFNLNAGVGIVCFIIPAMALGTHYYNTRGKAAAASTKFKITVFLTLMQVICAALTFYVAIQFFPELATLFSLLGSGLLLGVFGFILLIGFGASYWAFSFGNKQGRKQYKS